MNVQHCVAQQKTQAEPASTFCLPLNNLCSVYWSFWVRLENDIKPKRSDNKKLKDSSSDTGTLENSTEIKYLNHISATLCLRTVWHGQSSSLWHFHVWVRSNLQELLTIILDWKDASVYSNSVLSFFPWPASMNGNSHNVWTRISDHPDEAILD